MRVVGACDAPNGCKSCGQYPFKSDLHFLLVATFEVLLGYRSRYKNFPQEANDFCTQVVTCLILDVSSNDPDGFMHDFRDPDTTEIDLHNIFLFFNIIK